MELINTTTITTTTNIHKLNMNTKISLKSHKLKPNHKKKQKIQADTLHPIEIEYEYETDEYNEGGYNNQNVVSLDAVVIDNNYVDIFMVMDYAANDIQSIMHNNNKKINGKICKWYWPLNECKCLMYQLLLGINYLHSQYISNNGILKICGFDIARQFNNNINESKYTNYVVTLWYRAPELLLAYDKYSTPIDVWSIGCILAELLTGTPTDEICNAFFDWIQINDHHLYLYLYLYLYTIHNASVPVSTVCIFFLSFSISNSSLKLK